jgi:hypothetical protein
VREEHGRVTLFSVEVVTGKIKDLRELGEDLAPASDNFPGIRLSFTPDGKSLTYSAAEWRSSLWLLAGFQRPSLLRRLFGPTTLLTGGTPH